MKTIFTVLQDIEKLIYKVLMWIILIPKTIVRIVLQPKWAAKYIHSELSEGGSHFDEYVSPVILLLIVALLPSLGYNALPEFGVTLSSPAQTVPTTDRFLSFESQVDFISASKDLMYIVVWDVSKKNSDGGYDLEKSEQHPREAEGIAIEKLDLNTIKDRFLYAFSPGDYLVRVSAKNINVDNDVSHDLETYEGYLAVSVPVDSTAHVLVSSEGGSVLPEKEKNFLDRVKDEQTIFLALALMIPPLLFAFASQIIKVKMENIGEETLKESFYVQCYYFSPLSVAIWGTYYAYYFYTADVYSYVEFSTALQILLLPLVWAVLWFVRTEVKRIAWELETSKGQTSSQKAAKDTKTEEKDVKESGKSGFEEEDASVVVSKKNTTIASILVLFCIFLLGAGANILFSFNSYMDTLRLWSIRAFPALAVLLILGFTWQWIRRRQDRQEGLSDFKWNAAGLAGLTLVFFVVMTRIGNGMTAASPATVDLQGSPTMIVANSGSQIDATSVVVPNASSTPDVLLASPPANATPTLSSALPVLVDTPTPELSPFYTEEFNGDLVNWFDFMTYGDPRLIVEEVNLGKLSISIRPLEDKLAWFYLINNSFAYSDVKMEAVVTNQGNNANSVGLICRYSNVGWYEFAISNSGTYSIYAVDNQGIVNQGYNEIAVGGSTRIKTGLQTNVYMAICAGDQFTLLVNGEEVTTITDKRFQFAEGKIGLSLFSPQKLPVSVAFESLIVSRP